MGPNLGGETWGISGSTFLVVYLVIALAALVAVFGMRRSLRGTGFRADAAQLARSPEDVAYLNGGRDLAVYAALSAMHVDRSIGTAPGIKGMVRAGIRYVSSRPDLKMILFAAFLTTRPGTTAPAFSNAPAYSPQPC